LEGFPADFTLRGRRSASHGKRTPQPDLWFRYRAIDIRELDGDRLLEREEVDDNVIAILARLRDHKEAVRKIMERIASLAAVERETALRQLLILAGLRHLEEVVCHLKRKVTAG
jgi:hypothetical protein